MKAGAKAYIYHQAGYQFDAKPREELLKDKRLAQPTWSDSLKLMRERDGKDTEDYPYSNENSMLNKILFGVRKLINKDDMSEDEIEILEDGRNLNGSMIKSGLNFKDRASILETWLLSRQKRLES